ncbi:hypothetical protein MNBD_GAMMA14-2415 [hydrothermal vent metagenome]|uniref:Uncharacterized protein n=1 Tax=hydrothermal vent metagenome TaxID=652676 RepID=A0A3B0XX34_9ZZZZ
MLLAGRQTASGHQNDSIGSGEIVLEAPRPAKVAEYVLMGDRLKHNTFTRILISSFRRRPESRERSY